MIWHSEKPDFIETELQSSNVSGLTPQQVKFKLQSLEKNKPVAAVLSTFLKSFIKLFKKPEFVAFLAATIVSLVLQINSDHSWLFHILRVFVIIIIIYIISAVVSGISRHINRFNDKYSHEYKLIRGGKIVTKTAENLVPGDIILLESGDYIPCDARLIASENLICEQSLLQGNFLPCQKDHLAELEAITPLEERTNMIYKGCSITNGSCKAIVVEVGKNCAIDALEAAALPEELPKDNFKKAFKTAESSIKTFAIIFSLILLIFSLINAFFHNDIFFQISYAFFFATTLLISFAPLSRLISGIAKIGSYIRLKKVAKLKDFRTLFNLAEVDVLCADQTGTVTKGNMAVSKLLVGRDLVDADQNLNDDGRLLLRLAAAASVDENATDENPIDTALLSAASDYANASLVALAENYPILAEIPFDVDRKIRTTINLIDGKPYAITKGNVEDVLASCEPSSVKNVQESADFLSSHGFRLVAVAICPLEEVPTELTADFVEHDLTYAGIVALQDNVSAKTITDIKKLQKAGVKTFLLSGDSAPSVATLSMRLGIIENEEEVLSSVELDEMSEEELNATILNYSAVSGILPHHKPRIVAALQASGKRVGITGYIKEHLEAMRLAHTSFALKQKGINITSHAGDVLIKDDKYSSIAKVLLQSKTIITNIKLVLANSLVTSFALFLLISALFVIDFATGRTYYPMPFNASHIIMFFAILLIPVVGTMFDSSRVSSMKKTAELSFLPKGKLLGTVQALLLFASTVLSLVFGVMVRSHTDMGLPTYSRSTLYANRMLPHLVLAFALTALLFVLSNKAGKSILHLRFKYDKFTMGACVLALAVTVLMVVKFALNREIYSDSLISVATIPLIILVINEVAKFILYKFYYSKGIKKNGI